jgi:hypothetical protein
VTRFKSDEAEPQEVRPESLIALALPEVGSTATPPFLPEPADPLPGSEAVPLEERPQADTLPDFDDFFPPRDGAEEISDE